MNTVKLAVRFIEADGERITLMDLDMVPLRLGNTTCRDVGCDGPHGDMTVYPCTNCGAAV